MCQFLSLPYAARRGIDHPKLWRGVSVIVQIALRHTPESR
jgi:hypothetical protein